MTLPKGSPRSLIILFVPSVERDGKTKIDQPFWTEQALHWFAHTFGRATAYPPGRGVWKDDANGGALVFDEPVSVHCYVSPEVIHEPHKARALVSFCKKMGRETNQGEVGLMIEGEYFAIRDYSE